MAKKTWEVLSNFFTIVKGQLIWKQFFGVIDFLQKNKQMNSTYYDDNSGRIVFVHFLEEIDDLKKCFKIK